MAGGAVSLRKSHDIVILSFCNIVKGQAIYLFLQAVFHNFYVFVNCMDLDQSRQIHFDPDAPEKTKGKDH